MEQAAQIFKALGDETRLKILFTLSRKRICAKGLAKHLQISEAAVSQHIKLLKDAGIIVGEKTGYYVHYNVQKPILSEIIRLVRHLEGEQSACSCEFCIHMPDDCGVICKGQRNKCCAAKKL